MDLIIVFADTSSVLVLHFGYNRVAMPSIAWSGKILAFKPLINLKKCTGPSVVLVMEIGSERCSRKI